MKIALLALASLNTVPSRVSASVVCCYRAASSSSLQPRSLPLPSCLSTRSTVPMRTSVTTTVRTPSRAGKPIGATVRGLRSAARYTASHPFSVGSMLAAAFVIDRLELLAGLERVLKHWLELVLPALHKFILGRAAACSSSTR